MTSVGNVLITGGAGFIGSAMVRWLIGQTDSRVLNVDKLTYAGHLESLREVADSDRYHFLRADICDTAAMRKAFADFQPDAVMHLAAESHVDRSIDGPAPFIQTNLVGTASMLDVARAYWGQLPKAKQKAFRFHHISTDEVYGSLGATGFFTERTPYDPRSPYAASKAGSDHLAMAWHHTFGLPVVMTNCSNNYGPYQFPEKLIPLMILNALDRKPLPIYGKGDNVRDWLHVDDHVRALHRVLSAGRVGQTYNVGANSQRANLHVVEAICDILDELRPHADGSYRKLITFVPDRPGHDQRYAIDAAKLANELKWQPSETFESGLRKTIGWYLDNDWWWRPIRQRQYAGDRLGIGEHPEGTAR